MRVMCVIGSESPSMLVGIRTLFFMVKRTGTPSLDSDNRDDLLFFRWFVGLIGELLFGWYQELGDAENSSILNW